MLGLRRGESAWIILILLLVVFCSVPEVIAMPIVGGSPQYLEWLKNSTRDE